MSPRIIDKKYELVRLLGEGGMGEVHEAVHARTGRKVAVKLIRPEYASKPQLLERFEREARFVGGLRRRTSSRSSTAASTRPRRRDTSCSSCSAARTSARSSRASARSSPTSRSARGASAHRARRRARRRDYPPRHQAVEPVLEREPAGRRDHRQGPRLRHREGRARPRRGQAHAERRADWVARVHEPRASDRVEVRSTTAPTSGRWARCSTRR